MNENLLKSGIEVFIQNNLNTDIVSVLFKKSPFPGISPKELAQQLQGRQIAQKKLPSWFKTPGILYPKKLHLEQASSEKTASYKSQLVSGNSLLDLTGGLGVDTSFFAPHFDTVFYCESNEDLAHLTRHNFAQLGTSNINCVIGDGLDFLRSTSLTFDWIYLDPSRRSESKKVISLEEYEPNVLTILSDLFQKTSRILLKTSPLLDLELGLNQLQFVSEVHIVAVQNEVKELLWILNQSSDIKTSITTININTSEVDVFIFNYDAERNSVPVYGDPKKYLYEPNAAIMKSGAFGLIAKNYGLRKLAKHSHLYTSNELIDFPGRRFKIGHAAHFSNNWNKDKAIRKANITTRNFPLTVKVIRTKFKIADGGDDYLFFTTLESGEKQVIKCVKY